MGIFREHLIEKFSKKMSTEARECIGEKCQKFFFLNHFKLLFSEENGYLAHIKDTDLTSLVQWLKTKHQVT